MRIGNTRMCLLVNNLVYAFVIFRYLLEMEARAAMKIPRLKDMIESITKGVFGWPVSITHNSKMIEPIARSLFGTTITLFP